MSSKQNSISVAKAIKIVQRNVMDTDKVEQLEELGLEGLRECNNACSRLHIVADFFREVNGKNLNKLCDILGGCRFNFLVPLVLKEIEETKLIYTN